MIHSFRPSSVITPVFLAAALLAVTSRSWAQDGEPRKDGGTAVAPTPVPKGYPQELAAIPAGHAWMGLSGKDFEDLLKEIGPPKQNENLHKRFVKSLVRELGRDKVAVPGFYIGRHEVTNEEFAKFVKATGNRQPFHWWTKEDQAKHTQQFREANPNKDWEAIVYWQSKWPELKFEIPKGEERFPVVFVSLDDARAYCLWAGLRLPTEAEYHRAAIGDKDQRYIFADKWNNKLLERLRLQSLRHQHVKEIGSLGPEMRSAFGLDDMEGNVAEWIDRGFVEITGKRQFDKDFLGIPKQYRDPTYMPRWDESEGLVKGSAYTLGTPDQASETFRVNFRQAIPGHKPLGAVGFRVAKSRMPGKDAVVLRVTGGKSQYDFEQLGEHKIGREEARGIERWDYDAKGSIEGYHTVAFAPIAQFKELDSIKGFDEKAKDAPVPIAVVVSTEKIVEPSLEPGIHTVFYRAGGMPKDLEAALKEAEKEAKSAKKGEKAEKDKEKGAGSPKQEAASIDWRAVVKAYGVTEEQAQAKVRNIDNILIQPGNLLVPINKSLLLFRRNKGDFIASVPTVDAEMESSASEVTFQDSKDVIVFTSRIPGKNPDRKFRFNVQVKLEPGKLASAQWLRPRADMETAADALRTDKEKSSANKSEAAAPAAGGKPKEEKSPGAKPKDDKAVGGKPKEEGK